MINVYSHSLTKRCCLGSLQHWSGARSIAPWSIRGPGHFDGLRLLERRRRLRHQSPSDKLFQPVDQRIGVLCRVAQHRSDRGHLYSAGHAFGFRSWCGAPIPNWPLSRFALVYTSVMRNSSGTTRFSRPTRTSTVDQHRRRRFPQQSRPHDRSQKSEGGI
jgi:hypothetical protein